MQTAKHDLMRNTNTLCVLTCLLNHGPVTKREIQEKTGLSWGAVSNITGELLNKGVIVDSKSPDSSAGRTPSLLDIHPSRNLILGLDINTEGITAVLTDLKCRTLKRIRQEVKESGQEQIIRQVKQMASELMKEPDINREQMMGIGIAMQGAVDVERGVSVFSPHFPEWKDVPVKSILEEEFHLPVYLEHDPNCMALSERWLGKAKRVDDLLFIRLSMGIGMSILIHGEVYRGADGCAGEFGHIIMNPGGPRCSCGNFGCLETYASGSHLLQHAIEAVKLGRSPGLAALAANAELNLELVAEAARRGDEHMKNLFEEAGIYLGIGIANLLNIFNPGMIVIGGELVRYQDLILEKAREMVCRQAWKGSRVNLVVSELGSDAAAVGAAAVFIEKILKGELLHLLL